MADLRKGTEALKQIPSVSMNAEALSGHISAQGIAIANTQVPQNRSLPPEEWTGKAADAASSEIQALGTKTQGISEVFSPVAKALNDWAAKVNEEASNIRSIQRKWDEAVSAYNDAVAKAEETQQWAQQAGIPSLWGPSSLPFDDPAVIAAADTLLNEQAALKGKYAA